MSLKSGSIGQLNAFVFIWQREGDDDLEETIDVIGFEEQDKDHQWICSASPSTALEAAIGPNNNSSSNTGSYTKELLVDYSADFSYSYGMDNINRSIHLSFVYIYTTIGSQ